MIKAIALEGQSLLDLALQECGSIESAFDLAVKNGLSVTDYITPGKVLAKTNIVNTRIYDYYDDHKIQPATTDLIQTTIEFARVFGDEFGEEFS